MKYLIIAASIGMAVIAFISMATIGPAPFDFENASLEERQEWMDKQALTYKRSARFFLPSGGGPGALSFRLEEVVSDPSAGIMNFDIRVKVPYGATVQAAPYDQMLAKMCKNYVRTALHRESVRLSFRFNDASAGGTLSKLTVSPSRCETALAREAA